MRILSNLEIDIAAELLVKGEVIAFPTETVYGLGAPIFNETAIRKIFSVKGRPADNPLIAHIACLRDLEKIAKNIPKEVFQLAEAFWPGPLSILLEAREEIPLIARAGLPTIAVRMPAQEAALALIKALGEPLVAPSANLSGKPSSTTVEHVQQDFEGAIIAAIDGGPCIKGLESTVLDLYFGNGPRILRPGTVTTQAIEKVLQRPLICCVEEKLLCPGMKYRHYAPKAPIRLFYERAVMLDYLQNAPLCSRTILTREQKTLSAEGFYSALRKADQDSVEEIVILCDSLTRSDEALYNRILKAAGVHY